MSGWLINLFKRRAGKATLLKSAASNKYYIEKYKDFDKAIMTYYQAKDHNGKAVDIDGIVNPLKIDNKQECSVTD